MRESLNQWHFVIAAYGIGVVTTLGMVVWAWLGMKRAEARRDRIRNESRR